jgi:pyruvate,water dikinase
MPRRREVDAMKATRVTTCAAVMDFANIGLDDTATVGGKNVSLAEMFRAFKPRGVGVLDGFATTTAAYHDWRAADGLEARLRTIFSPFDPEDLGELKKRSHAARTAVLQTPLTEVLHTAITDAFDRLSNRIGREAAVAVRPSVVTDVLSDRSFASGAHTFLNVRARDELVGAVRASFASLFTERAIAGRMRRGCDPLSEGLSVGVTPMIRSDSASSGVIFNLDAESGVRDVVVITGSYGLGEFVVEGVVSPDEWTVYTPDLGEGRSAIIGRHLGSKEVRLVYADGGSGTCSDWTPDDERARFCLSDDDVLTLARWACLFEEYYSTLAGHPRPMALEWAKDGVSGDLVIVQAHRTDSAWSSSTIRRYTRARVA